MEPLFTEEEFKNSKELDQLPLKCEVCGEEIPEARLEANPSAKTCIEHSK